MRATTLAEHVRLIDACLADGAEVRRSWRVIQRALAPWEAVHAITERAEAAEAELARVTGERDRLRTERLEDKRSLAAWETAHLESERKRAAAEARVQALTVDKSALNDRERDWLSSMPSWVTTEPHVRETAIIDKFEELDIENALLRITMKLLADEAARAVCEPRRFCNNDDHCQQALGNAVAAARALLRST